MAALELDAEVEDVIGLLVDDRVRQAEFRNLRPHHAAGLGIGIEHGAVIAERREVARHRQRSGAAADQRDALAVLRHRLRHAVLDVVLEVGGDALQAADRDRGFLDAAAAAGRLARTIAGASQNSGKHIRFPVDHVGVAVAPISNQADIFGNGRVRGTGPLAIDHFVKVVGRRDISRFHSYLVRAISRKARPYFACERLASVLVVFELDHRLILLEPFQSLHKGKFVSSPAFDGRDSFGVNVREWNAAVQHVQCSFKLSKLMPSRMSSGQCAQMRRGVFRSAAEWRRSPPAGRRQSMVPASRPSSSRKPASATAKSRGVSTALVQTGL